MRSRFGVCLRALAVACGGTLAAASHAGSSLRSENHVFYSGTVGYNWATQAWDEDGSRYDTDCRSQYEQFSNYAEWGKSYYHTLYGQLGLARSVCGGDDETGVTDLKAGLRGRINRYLNDRAWELEVTIPTRKGGPGASSVSCGAAELAANVERQHDDVLPWLSVNYGASLRLAESPLEHSLRGKLGASGALAPRWRWRVAVEQAVPLTDHDDSAADLSLPDCGTDASSTRGGGEVKFQWVKNVTLGCGATMTFLGEDTRAYRGIYCGYSKLWE